MHQEHESWLHLTCNEMGFSGDQVKLVSTQCREISVEDHSRSIGSSQHELDDLVPRSDGHL